MERMKMNRVVALVASAFTLILPAAAEDPYIESLGTSGISTGYRMKGGISRVEVDYQLTTTAGSGQWRIFGDTSQEKTLATMFYYAGSGVGNASTFRIRGLSDTVSGDSQRVVTADTIRHTLVTDLKSGKNQIITDGTTWQGTFVASRFEGLTADLPLSLFAAYGNTNATKFLSGSFAKAKIYGVRIYENYVEGAENPPVHDFVPCLKDGVTPCFKDLVGGGFIVGENAAAFTASGNAPAYQDNGYVSTAANADGGTLYIDTGYVATDNTAVELDCALAANLMDGYANNTLWYLFDGTQGSQRFQFNFSNTSTAGYLRYSAAGNELTMASDLTAAFPTPSASVDFRSNRRTYILDNHNLMLAVKTAGFTNCTMRFTRNASHSGNTTLKLSSYYSGVNYNSAIKIYGCKIYESGALVRDFMPYVKDGIPGIYDTLTGKFISGSDGSGSSLLAYGGTISGENDAYIESNGSTGMSTGYCMTGAVSRVEVDFNLTTAAAQKYIYGDSSQGTFFTFLYTTGSGVGDSFKFGNRPYASNRCDTQWVMTPDTKRHTAVTDLKNKKNILTGLSPESKTFTSDFSGSVATLPLSIFGKYANAQGTSFNSSPQARIYSVRFYENYVEGGNNVPVRELVPYSRSGVVGFYDTVTGEIVKNDSAAAGAFTFGGAGTDHGDLTCYLKPGYATQVTHSGTAATLTAYAPGATSYKWLRDGQLVDDDGDGVADGADGVLSVNWAKGGTKTSEDYLHTYQAVAVFSLYGVERESEPTAEASVTSIYNGTAIVVR